MRKSALFAFAPVAAAVAIAGCGGSGGSGGSGAPKPGSGVRASLLATTKRTDGSTEVTYGGHPLYYYAGDTKPGSTTGQDINQFGALWYVLTASGAEVTHG